MPRYLPVQSGKKATIAICTRCQKKMYYSDMRRDPNNDNWYCRDCVDIFDPWRRAARIAEDISVQHPRPDEELV